MNLYQYVAYKNPEGAKRVINSYGEKAIRQPDILAKQLAEKVNKHGKEALYRITSVHPDLKLISDYHEVNAPKVEEKKEDKPCTCGKNDYSSADGAEASEVKKVVEDIKRKQEIDSVASASQKTEKSDRTELMIIGAVALIGLALVTRN
jgi:hypothetical protein